MIDPPLTLVLPRTGAVVAVVCTLALAPGSARAACGDHVSILGGSVARHAADHPGSDDPGPRLPCHGPSCSEQPSAPPAPLPPPVPVGHDLLACLVSVSVTDGCGARRLAPRSARLQPVDRPNPIYHPPRA